MLSRGEIRLNYKRSLELADELLNVADDIERKAEKKIEENISNLKRDWTGAAASKYTAIEQQLREQVKMTKQKIRKNADTIKQMARNTYNAEMEALRIAEEREARLKNQSTNVW